MGSILLDLVAAHAWSFISPSLGGGGGGCGAWSFISPSLQALVVFDHGGGVR